MKTPSASVKLFAGSFERQDGKRFEYMIECRIAYGGVVWFACVRHKGEYRASPTGSCQTLRWIDLRLNGPCAVSWKRDIHDGLDAVVGTR